MCGVSAEIEEVLGRDTSVQDARLFAEIYDVTPRRQFRWPQYPQSNQ